MDAERQSTYQDAKWYVVNTYSGYENKVKDNIEKASANRGMQDIILEIMIPTEKVEVEKEVKPKKTGRKKAQTEDVEESETVEVKKEKTIVERKLFPGYVFIKMVVTNESWYVVRNTSGVTGFVGPEGKPVPLTAEEVSRLNIEQTVIDFKFEIGDSVLIKNGVFQDYIGEIEKIDMETQTVVLAVDFGGKRTTAEADFSDIEGLD